MINKETNKNVLVHQTEYWQNYVFVVGTFGKEWMLLMSPPELGHKGTLYPKSIRKPGMLNTQGPLLKKKLQKFQKN